MFFAKIFLHRECCFPFHKNGNNCTNTKMLCTACMEIPGADNSKLFSLYSKTYSLFPSMKKASRIPGRFCFFYSTPY